MIKLIKPKIDPFGHCGDTSRELFDLWEENGLCEIEYRNTNYCWLNEIGDIMLYDRPTLQWYNKDDKSNMILWGNTVPDGGLPWIFWARKPRLIHEIREKGIKSYEERDILSIFLGKVENDVQFNNRKGNWKDYIEVFEMPIRGEYKYSQREYLELLSRSKFGLSLRGFGPKCNREIELMGMGVVPILSHNVDVTYHNPISEGEHYFRVNSPEEIKEIIDNTSQEKWEYMSNNCLKWYEENASIQGSFNVTMEIINSEK